MREVVIALAHRTAIGKGNKGNFAQTRPDTLGTAVLKGLLERAPDMDPALIGDVIMGCAMPEGAQGMNVGRNIALMAGLPVSVPGMTVNRFCSSGLETINIGALEIAAGRCDAVIAGGVESMSMVPMGGFRYLPSPELVAEAPATFTNMGLTAENLVADDELSREAQDQFALNSHIKALAAIKDGKFKDEIIPVKTAITKPGKKPVVVDLIVDTDEGPRADTSLEGLAKLRPAFKANGSVTAGNSSQVSDGAGAVLLTTPEFCAAIGLTPLARFVTYAVAGVEPELMGIGPVAAIPKALAQSGLTLDQMDVIELNEAFAAQSLSVLKRMNLDSTDPRINPNGGAIALGHPLGCTGAKLTATALHELTRRQGKYAMVTMCIGTGMGACGIFERL